jgi:hypothetical protein
MTGVALMDVWPEPTRNLAAALVADNRTEVEAQLSRVVIPRQAIKGTAESFSFMACPEPRLTYEQRCSAVFKEYESITIQIESGTITVDLDNFGFINWFYVVGLPSLYIALTSAQNEYSP